MKKTFLVLIYLFLAPSLVYAVQVIKVIDGDTLMMKGRKGVVWKVNLIGIDAPEVSEPYGREAMIYLSKLVNEVYACNKYTYSTGYLDGSDGVQLAQVKCKRVIINIEMLNAGLASRCKIFRSHCPNNDFPTFDHFGQLSFRGSVNDFV